MCQNRDRHTFPWKYEREDCSQWSGRGGDWERWRLGAGTELEGLCEEEIPFPRVKLLVVAEIILKKPNSKLKKGQNFCLQLQKAVLLNIVFLEKNLLPVVNTIS